MDVDNDNNPVINCAVICSGGWWYNNCELANMNGKYGSDESYQGIVWQSWHGLNYSLPFAEMKIRPNATGKKLLQEQSLFVLG